jgi:hypothetical protein
VETTRGARVSWETVGTRDVKVGDRVRYRDHEFTIARIDEKFLGMDAMICFIEDEPTRWFAYPAPVEGEIEVQRS